jgi:hypothetical protein
MHRLFCGRVWSVARRMHRRQTHGRLSACDERQPGSGKSLDRELWMWILPRDPRGSHGARHGRTIIAGELPNTPANLKAWIMNPVEIEPGTAMPNLGVTDGQAHDIAAYLYTLR